MNSKLKESDEALIIRCRRGENAAWAQLVRRYERLIYAIPRRAGLDADSAADVFQAVFAELIQQLGRIREPDKLQAWLVTTARRQTLKALARRSTVVPLDDGEDGSLADTLADPGPLPDEVLMELQTAQNLRLGLERLDERCRILLTELYCAETPASYDELAKRLDMPVGSIGPTRARCLEKLRKLILDV